MNNLTGVIVLVFTLSIVVYSTWQLFAGNLEAAFSAFPFLVVTYLYVLNVKRQSNNAIEERR